MDSLNEDIFSPSYVQRLQVANLQRMAAEQNAYRVQTYQGQCADWITTNVRNRDMGLAITALPTIPRKIVVSDAGEWSEVAFADLAPPVLPEPVIARTGSIPKATSVPPDRLDQVLAALQYLNSKLDAVLAAKAGV